ncbi:MAG: YraN family protein [Sulfuriflexus sp.]|nr:YraN family protein [Sulfuriflexus sp.]
MLQTKQQLTGKFNENLACQYLEKQGLVLVERNFSCRRGEIDIIMRDKDSIVFVEVRYRRTDKFGNAMESVNIHKQKRLSLTARHYLLQTRTPLNARFDVVAISGVEPNTTIEWVKNAFGT